MSPDPDDALVAFLCESGVIRSRDEATFTPLAGGVSSDIWKVETPTRVVCVKRALAQLKVDALWFAPVERNVCEVRWLQTANAIVPGVAPEVIAQDAQHGLFAMSYASAQDYPVWKSQLRAGRADAGFAARVGDCLARVHAGTAGADAVAKAFASDAIFTTSASSLICWPPPASTPIVHRDWRPWWMSLAAIVACWCTVM